MAGLEKFNDDFSLCTTCKTEYDDDQRSPKLLPCLHTVCSSCIPAPSEDSVSELTCVVCQEGYQLDNNLHLFKDCTMRNMMDMMKLQHKSSAILCSDCPDGAKGDNFCKDCYVFLCTECTNAHKRTQITRRHSILTIEELKADGAGSFNRKEMCSLPGHEEQPYSFYCDDKNCKRPICTQCVVTDHSQTNGHVIRNLNEVYDENKNLVEKMVGDVFNKISEVTREAKTLETEAGILEEKQSELNDRIDALFDSLEILLKERRKTLKSKVEELCNERKCRVTEQLERLQKAKQGMESSCNYSSRMVVYTNKPEFLQLKEVVLNRLQHLLEADYETEAVSAIELNFKSNVDEDQFQDFLEQIGNVQSKEETQKMEMPSLHNDLHTGSNSFASKYPPPSNGQYKMPYPGLPRNPPGRFNSTFPGVTENRKSRVDIEPLQLNSPANLKPSKTFNANLRSTSNKAPAKLPAQSENVLGRPMSLKAPVINPSRQPSSLGDFLKAQESYSDQKVQNSPASPTKYSPAVTPPYSPSSTLSPASPSAHYQSPSSNYVTSSAAMKYVKQPVNQSQTFSTVNGGLTSPGTQNSTPPKSPNTVRQKQNKPTTPKLTEESYPIAKHTQPHVKSPRSDKPSVFGDITCPEFQMDISSAHHEREVSDDGRTLRNKKTDIFTSNTGVDLEHKLIQYKGAIGTYPFKETGRFYFEIDVMYNIQQPLEETWLVFEIGLCRLDDVDMHHTVERHEHARSFYVARYPEDGKLTQEFWHNRDLLNFIPLSDNNAGLEIHVTYGLLVDTKRRKWTVVDGNNNKVLHTFDKLDLSEPLHTVFGCYNPDLITVEMTLKTGNEIQSLPECLQPGFKSP